VARKIKSKGDALTCQADLKAGEPEQFSDVFLERSLLSFSMSQAKFRPGKAPATERHWSHKRRQREWPKIEPGR